MFKEEIQEVNSGRLIDTNKICPYIKDKCLKNLCNAYAKHYETKIVTLQDKISYEDADIPWEYNLISNGWIFESSSKSCCGPDNQDSFYIKKSEILNLGRCLI